MHIFHFFNFFPHLAEYQKGVLKTPQQYKAGLPYGHSEFIYSLREAALTAVQQHAQWSESAGLAAAGRRAEQPCPHAEPISRPVGSLAHCRTGECFQSMYAHRLF